MFLFLFPPADSKMALGLDRKDLSGEILISAFLWRLAVLPGTLFPCGHSWLLKAYILVLISSNKKRQVLIQESSQSSSLTFLCRDWGHVPIYEPITVARWDVLP